MSEERDNTHGHDERHEHEHEQEQEQEHEHGDDHSPTHDHSHSHSHPHGGARAFLYDLFVPHTHDAADAIDDALEASTSGVRALKISMFVLLATTVLQFLVVLVTGSIALTADTIHNFSDALTALPLWLAFVLARRPASRRYTYGYGRAEDLAGLFIVFVVALSAVLAGWEAIDRLIHPVTVHNLWWLILAGAIGFLGNETVAMYRVRVGQRIGSAALVADGVHARLDGFTSLSVVLSAVIVMLGVPLADPIIGLLIAVSILLLLWGTVKSIGGRLMDGIDPELVHRAEHALLDTPGVVSVTRLQLRWVGHRLHGAASIQLAETSLSSADEVVHESEHRLRRALPNFDDIIIRATTRAGAPD